MHAVNLFELRQVPWNRGHIVSTKRKLHGTRSDKNMAFTTTIKPLKADECCSMQHCCEPRAAAQWVTLSCHPMLAPASISNNHAVSQPVAPARGNWKKVVSCGPAAACASAAGVLSSSPGIPSAPSPHRLLDAGDGVMVPAVWRRCCSL